MNMHMDVSYMIVHVYGYSCMKNFYWMRVTLINLTVHAQ